MLSRGDMGPRDMLEVRLILECQAAALAAQRATEDDMARIAAAIAALAGPTMAVEENIQADLNFHLGVAGASQNRLLYALAHTSRELLRDTIAASFALDPGVEPRRREHQRVLEGIRRRNPQAAEAAMRLHLRRTESLPRQHAGDEASPPPR